MKDYDLIVKSLIACANSPFCDECMLQTKPYCADELMICASDAIEELQNQVPKWIPVSERLPDKNMWCLVICNEWGGRITRISTFLADYFGERFEEDGKAITRFVTHWMPLHEPPKDGE